MGRMFARGYDFFMGPLEKKKFKKIREELLSKADGYVLEIGSGTGVNFHFYKSAEKLPFTDNSFDTVVATLVLCTIPNPEQAMNEIQRVCKPGGKLLFFEHVKMDNQFLAMLQEWLTPTWKKICDGCCLNRDTLTLIKKNDFIINEIKSYYNGLFISIETIKPKSDL